MQRRSCECGGLATSATALDRGVVDEVEEFVDVARAGREEVGEVGVLVDVEAEQRRDAPDRVGVLRVADVVEQLARFLVDAGPSPAARGDASGLQVLLIVVEGTEGRGPTSSANLPVILAVAAEDVEVELVVLETTEARRSGRP